MESYDKLWGVWNHWTKSDVFDVMGLTVGWMESYDKLWGGWSLMTNCGVYSIMGPIVGGILSLGTIYAVYGGLEPIVGVNGVLRPNVENVWTHMGLDLYHHSVMTPTIM